jgi:hypothetical protein
MAVAVANLGLNVSLDAGRGCLLKRREPDLAGQKQKEAEAQHELRRSASFHMRFS